MSDSSPHPPVARREPVRSDLHGDARVDDYAWLRDKENPEVIAYLEAENAYTESVLAPLKGLRDALYEEMLSHIKQTDLSVPYRDRGWWYFSRTEEGKQYPYLCRKRSSLDAPEEMLLDLNALAEGHPYFAIGAFSISDDGRWMIYSTDTTGFRQYTLRLRDLDSGSDLPFTAERAGAVAWANDSATLFYTVEDEQTKRHHRLYRYERGAAEAELVFEEPDELFHVSVYRTRSRRALVLAIMSHTTSEARILDPDTPVGEWRIVSPRRHEHEYYVESHGDDLYIRTNDAGRNFRLVRAPLADPDEPNWVEVLPHRPGVMLEDVDAFANHLVLGERAGGLPQLRVRTIADGADHLVEFPEPAYEVGSERNPEFDTATFRYAYESFVTPHSVFDYDMTTRAQTLLKQTEVPGYDRALYRSERLHARANDGTLIPISIVWRPDKTGDGAVAGPVLLNGYGSYGYPLPVMFSASRLALLDRGIAFAIAHIRGGGELGKPWHDAGKMAAKMTTFTDFIAAAEHLVAEGRTSHERLAITGGSAGGLLMGAVTNLRPDLFRAVVSHVPFVDVLNTMLDASLPLTIGEYEEWGNPNLPEHYAWMRTYCPYSNLAPGDYPAMLVRTALNDSQVMYWEPAKYVAKLRTLKRNAERPLLLETNMGAGHGGASGRYDYLREIALDYAFILWQIG